MEIGPHVFEKSVTQTHTDRRGSFITACTVVQAVVKATSQSNGKANF